MRCRGAKPERLLSLATRTGEIVVLAGAHAVSEDPPLVRGEADNAARSSGVAYQDRTVLCGHLNALAVGAETRSTP